VPEFGIASGKIITVSDGEKTAVYTHAAANRIEDFIDAINGTPGLKVKASLTSDGRLRLDATSINSIVIGGTADATELASIGLTATTLVGRLNTRRFALAKEYDSIRERIDAVTLKTEIPQANAAIGAKPAPDGAPITAASLGIARASYISDGDFQSNAVIEAARADLAAAADKLAALTAPAGGDSARAAHAEALARSVLDFFTDASRDPVISSADAALQLARDLGVSFARTPFSIINTARAPTLLTV
ncbi:MAG: hypothetical protein HY659_00425, partial [Rhizobiales bacterium]|nr:hypothetical protein [Hyphomicrobiales bacterium]